MASYGIDLGTTSCLAARLSQGFEEDEFELRCIDLDQGEQSFPSVISFLDESRFVVGEEAAKRLVEYPESTIELVKVRLGQTDRIPFQVSGREIQKAPQELTALFLKHINKASGMIVYG